MTKTNTFAAVALTVFFIAGCSTPSANSNDGRISQPRAVKTAGLNGAYSPTRDRIKRHVYVGLGLGASNLDPDASGNATFDVDNRVNATQLINAGVDLSRQFALDFQAVNLGSAGFSPNGDIEYREFNGSALYYIGKSRHRFKRRGFTGYGRIGAGYLDNTTNGVPFDQVNGLHVLLGIGAEYMTPIGLGLRAELTSYDEDINLANLGVIYRFGRQEKRRPIQTVAAPEPVPAPVEVEPAPVIQAAIAEPIPEPNACLELNGVADGVKFDSGSANLTDNSKDILGRFANTLAGCDGSSITVTAHTDSQGAADYNENLSLQRANSVVNFFEQSGVDTTRLRSVAFGERLPIDTNDTSEGRANNRRVELLINDVPE